MRKADHLPNDVEELKRLVLEKSAALAAQNAALDAQNTALTEQHVALDVQAAALVSASRRSMIFCMVLLAPAARFSAGPSPGK